MTNKYVTIDDSVFESIMQDCRDAALKVSDNLLEAHQIATMLYEGAINPSKDITTQPSIDDQKNIIATLMRKVKANVQAGNKPYMGLSKAEKMTLIRMNNVQQTNAVSDDSTDTVNTITKPVKKSTGIFDKWAKK